jgi:hypothetical protein
MVLKQMEWRKIGDDGQAIAAAESLWCAMKPNAQRFGYGRVAASGMLEVDHELCRPVPIGVMGTEHERRADDERLPFAPSWGR